MVEQRAQSAADSSWQHAYLCGRLLGYAPIDRLTDLREQLRAQGYVIAAEAVEQHLETRRRHG